MRIEHRWLLLATIAWVLLPSWSAAQDSCGRAGNLTYNCNLNNFVDRSDASSTRIVPDGWTPWVTMGNPAFDRDDHGSAPGAPAQRIWSDGGTWTAGLYQQVRVTAGKAYMARIDWAAPNASDIERRVGIDPTGGTDPSSARVVWGESSWVVERMPDLHVSTWAEASTVTVFVWTHHPVSHGQDQVFLDAITLVEDPTLAPRPSPTTVVPTPTRKPPTRTPAAIQAAATATPLPPSPTVTETTTALPTATATPTWTATPSPLPPSDTPTLSPTPTPTLTAVPVVSVAHPVEGSAAKARPSDSDGRPGKILLYVAAAALLGGLLLAAVVLWLWLRGRKGSDAQK